MRWGFPCRLAPALWVVLVGCQSNPSRPSVREQRTARFLVEEGKKLLDGGDRQGARGRFQAALDIDGRHPVAHRELGKIYYVFEDFPRAVHHLERSGRYEKKDPPLLWLAGAYLGMRDHENVVRTCRKILAVRKHDRNAFRLLLRALAALNLHDEGLSACKLAQERFGAAVPARIRMFKGFFLARTGRTGEALRIFEDLQAEGRDLDDWAGVLRLLYVKAMRYDRAIAVWGRRHMKSMVFSHDNILAGRFRNLTRLAGIAQRFKENAGLHFLLARAMMRVGWLEEAAAELRHALERLPGSEACHWLLERVEQVTGLIRGMRDHFYRSYQVYQQSGQTSSLAASLGKIRKLASGIEGLEFEVGDEVTTFSLFYNFLNPYYFAGARLPGFFRRHGMFLVLFDFFGPTECNLKNLLFLDPRRRKKVWGRTIEYEMAICETSEIYHYREYLGDSSYGGLAISPYSFWLDYETYRRIARQIWTSHEASRAAPRVLFSGVPGPADPGAIAGVRRLKEILAYLAGQRAGDWVRQGRFRGSPVQLLTSALLESAEYHELGHIKIQRDYLPVIKHPLRGLLLLFSQGFSPSNISAWSEEKAQLTALAHSRWPLLTLYRTVSSLAKDPGQSRHAQGYRRILESFVRQIRRHPARYPNVDTRRNVFGQLWRLTGDQVRDLARRTYG